MPPPPSLLSISLSSSSPVLFHFLISLPLVLRLAVSRFLLFEKLLRLEPSRAPHRIRNMEFSTQQRFNAASVVTSSTRKLISYTCSLKLHGIMSREIVQRDFFAHFLRLRINHVYRWDLEREMVHVIVPSQGPSEWGGGEQGKKWEQKGTSTYTKFVWKEQVTKG